jgi:hypothetical protein
MNERTTWTSLTCSRSFLCPVRDEYFSDCDRIPHKKNENEHTQTWRRGQTKMQKVSWRTQGKWRRSLHYNQIDACAPALASATIKLQLTLTSRHRLQLKAFDFVAAYLQAELKDPLYVYTPKGSMQRICQDPNKYGNWPRRSMVGPHPAGYSSIRYRTAAQLRVSHTWELRHLYDAGSKRFAWRCWWRNSL